MKFTHFSFLSFLTVFVLYISEFSWSRADEFRFCYNGIHKVVSTECSYGIYLPEPITSACIVHLPEKNGNGDRRNAIVVRLISSLCDADNPQESEMTPSVPYTNITFQHVNFLPINSQSLGYSAYGATGNECTTECEEDQATQILDFDPDEEDSDLPNPYESIPKNTTEIRLEQKRIHRAFLEYLLGLADGNGSMSDDLVLQDDTNDPRLLKLFHSSMGILQANCKDPWVPNEYLDTIYYAFKWMFQYLVPSDFKDIGIEQYKVLTHILDRCLAKSRTYELSGTVCDNRAMVTSINVTNKDGTSSSIRYKPKQNSYRWGKYDIFMESAWAAVDFVHGFCFSSFELDYNLEHIYFDGMDGLFNEEIQKRWLYFGRIKDEFYWDFLTGVAETKLMMRNINACLEASYMKSPYIHRIERPFYIEQPTQANGPEDDTGSLNFKIDDSDSWCAESLPRRESLLLYATGRCAK